MSSCYLLRFKMALTCWLLALPLWAGAQSGLNLPSRIELHPIQSTTVTGDDFLRGGQQGKTVTLAGELRLPIGTTAKYPVVVLVHGSGGVNGSMDMWLHQLNQAGIATFVLDTFSGRGVVSTVQDQTQLHSLAMMVDAYRALDLLAKHPRIDPQKISVMGFSKGAVASIFSASTRFKTMYGSSAQFAAHIGLYTPCNTRYLGDSQLTGAPMRLFHGTTDDYVSVVPCRSYVQTLKQLGVDVSLTEFPDTEHGYDSPLAPKRLPVPTAQSTRNCYFTEKTVAELVNEKTGAAFSYTDACVAVGAHVGHNPESTALTIQAVIEFLKSLKG